MRRIRKSDAARQERLDKRLYKSVVRGNISDVKQCINEGAKLVSFGELGTPLHAAVIKGHLSIAMLLLESGSPTNLLGDTNYAPLHLACRHKYSAIVSALINYNTDINIHSKFERRTPLHIAVRRDALEIVELLLAKKALVDSKDLYGGTPLQIACKWGHVDLVKFLLENGAKPDLYDNDGWSALHYAANEGLVDIIQILLEKRALIDPQNKFGRTPLHWACSSQQIPAVETLLSLGASTSIQDRGGKLAVNTTSNPVIKQIIKLYENNIPSDGGGNETTTLDLHMTLKPFIRSLSRMESRSSRVTNLDKTDSKDLTIDLPTSPDVSNSLTSTFGDDIIALIDECFGQNIDIAKDERMMGCHKYKQFLMAVASLISGSTHQINTLYSTVSAGLQHKSMLQVLDILKIVFEKIQTIEDNMNDYQREINAALRSLSTSIKCITESCVEYAEQSETKPEMFSMTDKVKYFVQARILEEISDILSRQKDLWRLLLPKLNTDLSEKDINDLNGRVESYSDDEKQRVLTMFYVWHIPKSKDESIEIDELCKCLSELQEGNEMAEEVRAVVDRHNSREPLIQLADLNVSHSEPMVVRKHTNKVSFRADFENDTDSVDC